MPRYSKPSIPHLDTFLSFCILGQALAIGRIPYGSPQRKTGPNAALYSIQCSCPSLWMRNSGLLSHGFASITQNRNPSCLLIGCPSSAQSPCQKRHAITFYPRIIYSGTWVLTGTCQKRRCTSGRLTAQSTSV